MCFSLIEQCNSQPGSASSQDVRRMCLVGKRGGGGKKRGGRGVLTIVQGADIQQLVGVNSSNGAASHVANIVHACTQGAH